MIGGDVPLYVKIWRILTHPGPCKTHTYFNKFLIIRVFHFLYKVENWRPVYDSFMILFNFQ